MGYSRYPGTVGVCIGVCDCHDSGDGWGSSLPAVREDGEYDQETVGERMELGGLYLFVKWLSTMVLAIFVGSAAKLAASSEERPKMRTIYAGAGVLLILSIYFMWETTINNWLQGG